MICTPSNFQGLSAECKALLQKVIGIEVTKPGTTSTAAEWVSLNANRLILADPTGMKGIAIDFVHGTEKTTDDPEIQTSNIGKKVKTFDFAPSLNGYANVSPCDYKTLFAMEGQAFDIRLLLGGKMIMGTNQPDGTKKGFRGTLYYKYDIPNVDNTQQNNMVMVFFEDVEEFKNFYVDRAEFTAGDLYGSVPSGITLSEKTAYIAGNVILSSKKRCTGELYEGFNASDRWNVLAVSEGVSDVLVTNAVNVNGDNTVTIKKNASTTPIDLEAGEYVIIQGFDDNTTYITYASDIFKVIA